MIFGLFGGNKKKKEFETWLQAGAHLSHPQLIGAFSGKVRAGFKSVSVVRMGVLSVRSAALVATDPAFLFESAVVEPFDQKIANGAHLCDALVVERSDGHKVAAVRLSFASGVVETLEPAWFQSSRQKLESKGELPSISVDSAHAALLTPEALALVKTEVKEPSDLLPGSDVAGIESGTVWQETKFSDGSNMFVVPSGMGDGGYNCYFGKTTTGARTAFFIDFRIFGDPERSFPEQPFGSV